MINPTSTCDHHLFTQHIAVLSNYTFMISLIIKDFNALDKIISSKDLQSHYDKVISHYDYLTFKCSECNNCWWHIHGYYKRKIIIYGYMFEISVVRIKCANCNVTHVILPSFIIPFNLNSIKDLLLDIKIKIKAIIDLVTSKARKLLLIFLYPT